MREIKFRIFNLRVGEMGEPYTLIEAMTDSFKMSDDLIYMQLTGLADKNGVEIYEGDILGYPLEGLSRVGKAWGKHYKYWRAVEFKEGAFVIEHSNGITYMKDHMEVIGNIWENPELLEQAS